MDDLEAALMDTDLDPDVLQAARSLAQAQGKPLSRILSDLARRGYEFWPEDVAIVNHVSEIPAFPPDLGTYPLFRKAVFATVDLHPGDMLYIPTRWWHWVTSFDRNLALSLWHAADRRAGAPAETGVSETVDVITDPSLFSSYFPRKQPVVVRPAGVPEWPAFRTWTDEHLLEASGDRKHNVEIAADRHLRFTQGSHRTRVEPLTLREFLERTKAGAEYHYLAQNDAIPKLLPAEWSIPAFWKACFGDDAFRAPFWYCFGGREGVVSPLHFDYYENLLVQIAGSKRILLFAPSQSPYLYRKAQMLLAPGKPD
jgi:ribosomal protein L16 Arg81 hydroxylase